MDNLRGKMRDRRYYTVIYYIVQQVTLHEDKVFQVTMIPSGTVTFQLRTIFDDNDSVIFT